jgi:hypothetical protein
MGEGTIIHHVRVALPSYGTFTDCNMRGAYAVGRRKNACSSITSPLKTWACVLTSMYPFYSM